MAMLAMAIPIPAGKTEQQVNEIHGIDLGAPPPGPMPQQVIDSHS